MSRISSALNDGNDVKLNGGAFGNEILAGGFSGSLDSNVSKNDCLGGATVAYALVV